MVNVYVVEVTLKPRYDVRILEKESDYEYTAPAYLRFGDGVCSGFTVTCCNKKDALQTASSYASEELSTIILQKCAMERLIREIDRKYYSALFGDDDE